MKRLRCCFYAFLIIVVSSACTNNTNQTTIPQTVPTIEASPIIAPTDTVEPEFTPITPVELPSIALSANTSLQPLPSMTDTGIEGISVASGEPVYVLGKDKDSAWLLVVYKNLIGWIPSVYSITGVGTLNATTITDNSLAGCSAYQGTLSIHNSVWESIVDGSVKLYGYLYQMPSVSSDNITLTIENKETGKQFTPKLSSLLTNSGGKIITLSTVIDNLQKGNHLAYHVNGIATNSLPVQLSLFTEDCSSQKDGPLSPGQTPSSLATPTLEVRVIYITSTYVPNLPSTPNSGFSWSKCHAVYGSHLSVGMYAMVSYTPPQPNNVRSNPYVNAHLLGEIQPGEVVKIIKGPSCSNGWVWWKISTQDGRLSGWTSEGDSNGYWLLPR